MSFLRQKQVTQCFFDSQIWINMFWVNSHLKFIYSEKATKFCEISTLILSYVVPVKSKVEILQNFVAFSEYMNFSSSVLHTLKQPKMQQIFTASYFFFNPCLMPQAKMYLCNCILELVIDQILTRILINWHIAKYIQC